MIERGNPRPSPRIRSAAAWARDLFFFFLLRPLMMDRFCCLPSAQTKRMWVRMPIANNKKTLMELFPLKVARCSCSSRVQLCHRRPRRRLWWWHDTCSPGACSRPFHVKTINQCHYTTTTTSSSSHSLTQSLTRSQLSILMTVTPTTTTAVKQKRSQCSSHNDAIITIGSRRA